MRWIVGGRAALASAVFTEPDCHPTVI
jgi:hypothetical protein